MYNTLLRLTIIYILNLSSLCVAANSTFHSINIDSKITDINFIDSNLRNCVLAFANEQGWSLVSEVTIIKCDNSNITNLDGIQNFDLLKELILRSNKISDITPIDNLTQLNRLYLSDNLITDISSLSNLLNLQYLLLDKNEISDLSPLSNLSQLKTLFLHQNQINDTAVIANFVALQRLNLSNNNISNLSSLANLIELEWLLLSNNQISDISALEQLTQLQLLDLNLNNISDISPLADLYGLQTLYVGYNQLNEISALSKLTQLRTLLLQNNQIINIAVLTNLTNLQTLYLQYNQINDISSLYNLVDTNNIILAKNPDIPCEQFYLLQALTNNENIVIPERCAEYNVVINVSFSNSTTSIPTTNNHSITARPLVGDANGDGITDVIWTNQTTAGLRTYVSLGQGNGTYGPSTTSVPATSDHSTTSKPLLGDGIADVIWTNQTTAGLRTYVSLGQGDGTYSTSTTSVPTTNNHSSTAKPLSGDANGDGITDIIWTNQTTAGLRTYVSLGQGDGTYSKSTTSVPTTNNHSTTSSPLTADTNGDGITDVIWTNQTSGGLRAYVSLGQGDGTYSISTTSVPATNDHSPTSRPVAGDTNGDGIADLIWTNQTSGGLRAYVSLGHGDGSFGTSTTSVPTTNNHSTTARPLVGDANGDGITDIIWTNQTTAGLRTYVSLGQGDGTYGPSNTSVPTTNDHSSTSKPSLGDTNGDGLTDVIWTNQSTAGLRTYVSLAELTIQ